MNKQEMLEEYGDIPLKFKSWYKNEFTLTASWVNDIDDHDKLLVIFAPDYRNYLGFQVNTTIRELIQNDDHAHLSILDGWEGELSISGLPQRKQVYYGEGEL